MLARGVQGLAMAIGAVAVIRYLTPTDQGFYFAFISFGILLQLCDFGLSYACLQTASQLQALGRTTELPALAARALRINVVVTVVVSLAVFVLGVWTFARVTEPVMQPWRLAWFVYVLAVACNHLTAPWISLVEGGVSVARAWRFRLWQESASGIALLAVLASGHGLWALVAYFVVRCATGLAWMRRTPLAAGPVGDSAFTLARWRIELWPFQWRVGLGAIAGYLVFQAFGPILFALHGPEEAGRFSLSLAVMNAIVMVTTAWPISQAAHFGVMLGRSEDLSIRWSRLVAGSTALAALAVLLAIGAFLALRALVPEVMSRFADPTTTVLLITSAIAHHLLACVSVVLRSEGREPMLGLGIVAGLVTVGLMSFAAIEADLPFVALAYLACSMATLPVAFAIYGSFQRRHRAFAAFR